MRGIHPLRRSLRSSVSGVGPKDGCFPEPARNFVQRVRFQPVSSLPEREPAPVENKEMVTVQFRGNEFSVPKGTTLRTALLQNGLSPHNGRAVFVNCRMGTCGTCAVKIDGKVVPEEWSRKESIRLNLPPHSPPQNVNLRLACSVQVDGDLNVTKFNKFWGQDSGLLKKCLAKSLDMQRMKEEISVYEGIMNTKFRRRKWARLEKEKEKYLVGILLQ